MNASDSQLAAVAEFGAAMAEVTGVEAVVDQALASIDTMLGFHHLLLMIHDLDTDRLTTIASRGYDVVGIGSEVQVGQGVIGKVAETRRPMRIGNLQRMLAYVKTVQQSMSDGEAVNSVALPGLPLARSQVAAPMIADGVLLGVIAAESEQALAFDDTAQLVLTIAAQLVAGALEWAEIIERDGEPEPRPVDDTSRSSVAAQAAEPRPAARLRHYTSDGSTFIDDEYIIKGVAGRLLWKVAAEHVATGRAAYTNREARLDPALDLPNFRDNFESRLVLLKRRLAERAAPLQISRTGRGRFEVSVLAPLILERMDQS